MNENLYHRFSRCFPRDRSTTLIAGPGGSVADYRMLESASARYAHQLTDMGAKPGDRITLQAEKSVKALWVYLGCLRAGLVLQPLNPAYRARELQYFLDDAEPKIVIGDRVTLPTLGPLAPSGTLVTDIDDLSGYAESRDGDFRTLESGPDALAVLLYSSGTTGKPKGIMLTHRNLGTNAETLANAWGFTAEDLLLHALPIFHVHGLLVAIGCVLMSGSGMYWQNRFRVDRVLAALPACSVMMGVPTYYTRLLGSAEFTKDHTRNTRLFISGSAPLSPQTFHEFEERTGHRILERYGMTETGMNTSNPLEGKRIPGTVGPPLPGIHLRVLDERGAALPPGAVGALQVRGPNVFRGYWKLPEKTADDFTKDGFFRTGDLGQIDKKGYLSIVGREKDMVITGGLNVYPGELEILLDRRQDIAESAVFGIPDADFGEAVVAAIVTRVPGALSDRDIIRFVKSQVAAFKVPKAVVFLRELPRNAMGKVLKKQLRDAYGDLLSRQAPDSGDER